ncbi:MAG: hypothetical protein IJV66_04035 [Firmicutes bacterium]|nr:hypothetical protein [Bacillota bacterium]
MKMRHHILTFLTVAVLMLAMTVTASANDYRVDDGTCTFDGQKMSISFPNGSLKDAVQNLEPGDSLKFLVTYENDSQYTTQWYMRNRVLQTLEDNKEAAENGGYTYILQNIGPDKTKTTYFDNSDVGGEAKAAALEGLKQATNATTDYFFIQELKPGQSGQTYIKVEFDGETEVNDYMDTLGGLDVAYAVEVPESNGGDGNSPYESSPVTGDPVNIIKWVALMTAALIIGLLAFFSWRKERKDGDEA